MNSVQALQEADKILEMLFSGRDEQYAGEYPEVLGGVAIGFGAQETAELLAEYDYMLRQAFGTFQCQDCSKEFPMQQMCCGTCGGTDTYCIACCAPNHKGRIYDGLCAGGGTFERCE